MSRAIKTSVLYAIVLALCVSLVFGAMTTKLSLQGEARLTGGSLVTQGDLRVVVDDESSCSASSPILNQTFTDGIVNGRFDELLSLFLNYNDDYYLCIFVEEEQVGTPYTFRGGQGEIATEDILNGSIVGADISASTTLTIATVNATGNIYGDFVGDVTGTADVATTWNGETSQADLNVNSSNNWDNLDTPSDINAGDITNDGTYRLQSWNNLTGIPHATPNNGDVTHFSLADEIFDWVVGLAYATSSYVDSLGNWSADKSSYYTSAEVDTEIGNANDSMKVYVDSQDVIYNDSMKVYVDAQDVVYNDSMKAYADARDLVDDLHKHSAENITSGTFDSGDFVFQGLVTSTEFVGTVNGSNIANMDITCVADTFMTAFNFSDESSTCTAISDVYLKNDGDTASGNYTFDTNTLHIDSTNDRVGIGTTDPARLLHLHSAGDNQLIQFTSDSTGSASSDGFSLGVASGNDTQLWNWENGYLRFGTNGTERMRIDSSGSVGIGTALPGAKLDVGGSVSGGDVELFITNIANSGVDDGAVLRLIPSTNDGVGGRIISDRGGRGAAQGSLYFSASDAAAENIRMTIDGSLGNVGIGTTTPSQLLHVYESRSSNAGIGIFEGGDSGRIYLGDLNAVSGQRNFAIRSQDGVLHFDSMTDAWDDFVNTSIFNIKYDGNVGIGTTSPSTKLEVVGTIKASPVEVGNAKSYFTSSDGLFNNRYTSGYAYQDLAINYNLFPRNVIGTSIGTEHLLIGTRGTGTVGLSTNDNVRLLVDESGNVGIGTSAPDSRLHVANDLGDYTPTAFNHGQIHIGGGDGTSDKVGIRFTDVAGSHENWFGIVEITNTEADFVFQGFDGSAYKEYVRIDNDGNVGIGTDSPDEKLHVDGNIKFGESTMSSITFTIPDTTNTEILMWNQTIPVGEFTLKASLSCYGGAGSGEAVWEGIIGGYSGTSNNFTYSDIVEVADDSEVTMSMNHTLGMGVVINAKNTDTGNDKSCRGYTILTFV